jgi:hypothetical protein
MQNCSQVHGLASFLSSSFSRRHRVDGRNLLTLRSHVPALYFEDALHPKRRWISTRIRGIVCRGVWHHVLGCVASRAGMCGIMRRGVWHHVSGCVASCAGVCGIMCRGVAVFFVLIVLSTVKILICFGVASTQFWLRSSQQFSEW